MPSSEEYAPSVEGLGSSGDDVSQHSDGSYNPSPPTTSGPKRKSDATSTQPTKRASTGKGKAPAPPQLDMLLKTASRAQLMQLVQKLAEDYPGVQECALDQLQKVDVTELRERFMALANAAEKALPRYKNGDHFSLQRVKPLLSAFKREVQSTVKTFSDAKSWSVLPEIVDAALDAVNSLPSFDRVREGTAGLVEGPMRKALAKTLARALKGSKASTAECKKWQLRLKPYGLENEIKC